MELVFFKKDFNFSRYHGQLDLLTGTGERVVLNQWLVETQFAVYSAAKEREELDNRN